MRIEIINTGRELLLGHVLNTHQAWLACRLAELGLTIARQVAVADSGAAIRGAVHEALGRAEIVITTGGLGPTSDDLTRHEIAALLNRPLREDPSVVRQIENFFATRRRPMPAKTRIQALVPEGAIVLSNSHGTAPGLVIEAQGANDQTGSHPVLLILLPGPPRELHPMFAEQVVPLLRRRFPEVASVVCRTLKTIGLGESLLEERIGDLLQPQVAAGLELGYCARLGEVDVRLLGTGRAGPRLVAEAECIVRGALQGYVFGADDDQLESIVISLLKERQQALALAESCTGGLLAHKLTNVPGASEVFRCGLVTYSNASKEKLLGVRSATLAAHGAVSEQTAREMAEGVRTRVEADWAVAVTGIAGPGGGTPSKPVGTVFTAVATASGTTVVRQFYPYDRETFKEITAKQALDLLRRGMCLAQRNRPD